MDALSLMKEHKALLSQFRLQFESKRKAIDAALETLDGMVDAPEGRTWIASIRRARARYSAASLHVLKLLEEGRREEAVNLTDAEVLPALEDLQVPIKALLTSQKKDLLAGDAGATKKIDSAITMMKVLEGAPKAVWRSSPGSA